jgi:hypothetical protein
MAEATDKSMKAGKLAVSQKIVGEKIAMELIDQVVRVSAGYNSYASSLVEAC